MKYVIDIPDEIEQALERRASATGDDVVRLIQIAVATFVRSDVTLSLTGRRPDQPLEAVETVVPCDLPRATQRPIPVQTHARRQPDPIADSA